jgi:hypothetical protein
MLNVWQQRQLMLKISIYRQEHSGWVCKRVRDTFKDGPQTLQLNVSKNKQQLYRYTQTVYYGFGEVFRR